MKDLWGFVGYLMSFGGVTPHWAKTPKARWVQVVSLLVLLLIGAALSAPLYLQGK